MGRRRSATTADDASPGFQDGAHGLCESCGIDIVDRGTIFGDAWESRIGLHHEWAAGVRGHLRDERRDLAWAERAVDANGRGTERGERGGGNGGCRAHEGTTILAEGHRHEDRQRRVVEAGEQRRFGFEQIGEGFEKDEVATSCAGGAGLFGEDIVGLLEAEFPKRGKQRSGRTDVTGNKRCSRITRDLGCGCVELIDARVMIREFEAVRVEGVGGDAIATCFDIAALQGAYVVCVREVEEVRHIVDLREARLLDEASHAAIA